MENQQKTNNTYNFELEFASYLKRQRASASTVKNYAADLRLFLQWLESSRGMTLTLTDIPEVYSVETVQQYELSLINNHASKATINRRMASLSAFADFCSVQGWLPAGFSKTLVRVGYEKKQNSHESAMKSFAQYLLLQGAKDTTIKNYLLDVREYIGITSSNQA